MTTNRPARDPQLGETLRLHLNEHTGGCSPEALDALHRLTAEQVAAYPDYRRAAARVAAHFGVAPERVLLTNGLDEGILVAALAWLGPNRRPWEVVVIEPAFELYGLYAEALGARVVRVAPRENFAFPLDETLAAIGPATRLVFLTSPNNPTGQLVPPQAIRAILQAAPPSAFVFLDEAYAEFAGASFLDEAARHPRLVVGRTFAKAYGLAGLRLGALVGDPETLAPLGRLIPPYSVNAAAVAVIEAALDDTGHVRRYLTASKRLLYAACERLGLTYWPSAANFVLIRIGPDVRAVIEGLAARGIAVRDRSDAPGCAGCLRITAGLVADTRRAIAALEEVLCAQR